ncbi:hemicentin-1-like [Belonocnema kinseyi]|uniref:hemicentin-1-like n=1 Tax=Belonocnema kinseyi TaxID=2817044 RepID=UPI00143D1120|nr:hemicentin-1-like [Belonocnema kinseyi]
MAAYKLVAILATVLQLCLCQITPEVMPEFLFPLENHTVIQGRDVVFTCVVNHLQTFKAGRIARGDPGINPLDAACKKHDIAYKQNKENIQARNSADSVLADEAWKHVFAQDTGLITAAEKAMIQSNDAQTIIKSALKSVRAAVKKTGGKRNVEKPRSLPVPKKLGGFLPFLIPIFAGLSATGALDSGAVGIDKALTEMGYMNVVIPPDIMDDESSNGLVTHEGGNIRLKCIATGTPEPTVTWKREDGRNIVLRENGQKKSLSRYEGETLELAGVLRQEMGNYLCIASNGVPPSVSKRYSVHVHFPPVIKVSNQLVAAPINSSVTLQCSVEASPHAMNTWYKNTSDKLLPNDKYTMKEQALNDYSWIMNLTVHDLEKKDFHGYICSSVNALGKAEGVVRLQELHLMPKTTPITVPKHVEIKPRKKPVNKGRKKIGNRRQHHNEDFEDFDPGIGNEDDFGTTQIMAGSTQEGQKTERPLIVPSLSPPWVILNAASTRQYFLSQYLFLILLHIMTL